ncbi:hypothetical protein [Serratia fonticola]|uniref:Uncharacterized protein n=1 Tax=Serratia fonticola TaxID=47917 RepID=A0AAW3WT54_SERFO|nr:hypothetical protein [Serratia fonticola]MBC3213839.1 hypothetical protein [Serratia fonticola]NYA13112.1 hypothetical protein [Serratia fonticola]NYA33439.1 hypothetical protein [Serratia fonticola]
MSIKKIYQLECVPDFRHEETAINYSDISCDADTKLISILEAVGCLGIKLMDGVEKKDMDTNEVARLGGVISDLSEVAIFINKISGSSGYLAGIKDGSGHDANH